MAANGHGGIVALKSLEMVFDKIYLISEDEELIKLLRKQDARINDFNDVDIEVVVCANYIKIISSDVLSNKVIINTHPSLLPKYRGFHSLAWAMLNNEPIVGFTIHLMNENIDDGDILAQYKVSVGDRSSKEIMDLFDKYVLDNLGEVVCEFLSGNVILSKQDFSEATWCCRRNIQDCILEYTLGFDELNAVIKTLVAPYPLPMLSIEGKLYEVTESEVIRHPIKMHLGRIVNIQENITFISFNHCILKVKKVNIYKGESVDFHKMFKIGKRLI
ncbi:hypothetical protein L5M51_15295 [Shewanella sp. SM73]|uniref:formyltransferase family protein n=1 Tax=Shewanella sp. SM73 TaxID=2912806 RepID=UPI0021D8BA69|nr:formyltransferase family protein [Shewanella sp. SM73]MCU8031117.1 hypothetical protein [Shewanella sp. SM73]